MPDERTSLLQKNIDEEQLEEGTNGLYTFSKKTFNHRDTDGKLMRYNAEQTTGWGAIWQWTGTIIASSELWRTCLVYWVVCFFIALSIFISRVMRTKLTSQLKIDSDKNMMHLTTVTTYVTALLGIMIGFFVTQSLSRWWNVREKGVGHMWNQINNINFFLAVRLVEPEDKHLKETVLRLCLLIHRLLYMEAQKLDTEDDMFRLIKVGLLTHEENDKLRGQPGKAQCVTVWLDRFLHVMVMGQGKVNNKEIRQLDLLCAHLRDSIGITFAYVQTQLPFQYVHLLSLSILVSNLLVAVKCGVAIGRTVSPDTPNDYVYTAVQVFQVFFVPFSYHAFVRMCEGLSNPIGDDFGDLPGYAFHCHIRSEVLAIHKAGEDLPKGLQQLPEGVEWRTGPPMRKTVAA